MAERYAELVNRLREAVLGSHGAVERTHREVIESHAAVLGGRTGSSSVSAVPEALRHYADTVARAAHRVTDADVALLRQAGYSEDAIFEVTASAALGAGLGRLDRGLAALKGEV